MTPNEIQSDPVMAALRELRTFDVSPARARRLRARSLGRLETRDSAGDGIHVARTSPWHHAARLLAGAWCALYLVETIRRAAAVYGF